MKTTMPPVPVLVASLAAIAVACTNPPARAGIPPHQHEGVVMISIHGGGERFLPSLGAAGRRYSKEAYQVDKVLEEPDEWSVDSGPIHLYPDPGEDFRGQIYVLILEDRNWVPVVPAE